MIDDEGMPRKDKNFDRGGRAARTGKNNRWWCGTGFECQLTLPLGGDSALRSPRRRAATASRFAGRLIVPGQWGLKRSSHHPADNMGNPVGQKNSGKE